MSKDPDSDDGGFDSVGDTDETVYRTHHDMSDGGLSVTVAMAVAEATDRPKTAVVDEFSEYADPDAVDRLFRVDADEQPLEGGMLLLTIDGHVVRMYSDGVIEVER